MINCRSVEGGGGIFNITSWTENVAITIQPVHLQLESSSSLEHNCSQHQMG